MLADHHHPAPDGASPAGPAVATIDLHHERHGRARPGTTPLLLVHGGGSTIGTNSGALLPVLSATRPVVAVELQGHGHTPSTDSPSAPSTSSASTTAGRSRCGSRSPDPAHQQQLFELDQEQMFAGFTDWPDADLTSITAPTLLVVGDRDVVRVEHVAAAGDLTAMHATVPWLTGFLDA